MFDTIRSGLRDALGRTEPNSLLHDFRQAVWGHNVEVMRSTGPDTAVVMTWSSPRPLVGDRMVWRTEYGECVVLVIDVHHYTNVMDMARCTVRVIERRRKNT